MFKTLKTYAISTLLLASVTVGAQAAEVTLKGASGLTLAANLELADGKSVADGVILFTHGTFSHNKHELVTTMQGLLAERGYSSLAPTLSLGVDMRKGPYDCAVPITHKHTDAMAEMGEWLNWLKGEGATSVAVMGHSRGGNQTAWFAAREDDPTITKVILWAAQTWTMADTAAGFKKRHGRDLAGAFTEAQALVDAGKGDQMMKGSGLLYCPGADVTAASFADYYANDERMHTPKLLELINKPVLVIAGTEDTVVPDLIEAVKPMADGVKVQLAVIEDSGHFFPEFYSEDAADAIDEFMAQ
ncbi:alpha/beta hydrolase [Pseudomonadota bacterium]